MKYMLFVIVFSLAIVYPNSGQEYSKQLDEAARVIDDHLIKQTIKEYPDPRLIRLADIDRAGKQDLYLATSNCDGYKPDVIKYGDFNRDFILDAVILGRSDHSNYVGKMFVAIYSFKNVDSPEVEYLQEFNSSVATATIVHIPQHAYPIIHVLFTYASDDAVAVFWNGVEYITGYADGE